MQRLSTIIRIKCILILWLISNISYGVNLSYSTVFSITTTLFDTNIDDGLSAHHKEESVIDAYLKPDLVLSWQSNLKQVRFSPALNHVKLRESKKTYFEVYELIYSHMFNTHCLEFQLGLGHYSFGNSEVLNIVDVINQNDLRSSQSKAGKLGQPVVSLNFFNSTGVFAFYLLPLFRPQELPIDFSNERVFNNSVSVNPLYLDIDNQTWESNKEENNVDLAIKWERHLKNTDIGILLFSGTNREPIFGILNEQGDTNHIKEHNGRSLILPHYEQMIQLGIVSQTTINRWLIKTETIYRRSQSLKRPTISQDNDFVSLIIGGEYSLSNIMKTNGDLSLISEYLWDERRSDSTTGMENDLFLGLRYQFNNIHDLNMSLGSVIDLTKHTSGWQININTRKSDYARVSLIGALNKQGSVVNHEKTLKLELSVFF